jgi:hypothetical protein
VQSAESAQEVETLAQRITSELTIQTEHGEAPDLDTVRSLLMQVQGRSVEIAEIAAHQERLIAELEMLAPSVLRCPILDRDVQDLSDLAELAKHVTELVRTAP